MQYVAWLKKCGMLHFWGNGCVTSLEKWDMLPVWKDGICCISGEMSYVAYLRKWVVLSVWGNELCCLISSKWLIPCHGKGICCLSWEMRYDVIRGKGNMLRPLENIIYWLPWEIRYVACLSQKRVHACDGNQDVLRKRECFIMVNMWDWLTWLTPCYNGMYTTQNIIYYK